MTKDKTYKRFYPALKWALALLSIGYFLFEWKNGGAMDAAVMREEVQAAWPQVILLVLLMFLNWFLESTKFRLLLSHAISLSALRAFMTVLSGTTISNFTPARTGDYIGRTLLLKELPAVRVVVPTVTGNLLQLAMTYFFGLFSLSYMVLNLDGLERYNNVGQVMWLSAAVLFFLFIAVLFLRKLVKRQNKAWPTWLLKVTAILKQYGQEVILKATLWSALRYIVFSVQFFLVLQLFSDAHLSIHTLLFIPAIYLFQSLMPIPAVTDVGFRMYFTSMFFASYMSSTEITHAVMALWTVNLIIPGAIGAFYLLYSLFAQRDTSDTV